MKDSSKPDKKVLLSSPRLVPLSGVHAGAPCPTDRLYGLTTAEGLLEAGPPDAIRRRLGEGERISPARPPMQPERQARATTRLASPSLGATLLGNAGSLPASTRRDEELLTHPMIVPARAATRAKAS